jgi:hypothetical protein
MRGFALAVVVVLGCGGDKSGGHCVLGNACEDYGTSDLATHEKDCKTLTGTWEAGSCPTSKLVGDCVTDKTIKRSYYSGGANAFTVETATASCEHEFHGTWKTAK